MQNDERVQQLLDQIFDNNSTPEEVCRACPELLPDVQQRWSRLRKIHAEIDALFPTPRNSSPIPPGPMRDTGTLPHIAGYEVEDVLGRGGMGIVFRARHVRLNRLVALKMLPAGGAASSQERARFQREAESVARLKHPNIVQIHDVDDSDNGPYFTMEYVASGSLAHKLAGAPQPARQAAELAVTLAGAVQAAHERGIIHRDLKPANVLLAEDGTPKISDFGLAHLWGEGAVLTQTGAAVGTPSYMAPEQARGRPDAVGPAADVYALGAILYELLTGRPPFRAATAAETVQQVISEEPAPPSRLNGEVPRDLETICLKCLNKEPHLRYAGAAALAEDLGCFLRGAAIAARPEGTMERLMRRVRRRPALAAACGVGAILALALIGGGMWVAAEKAAGERRRQAEQAAVEHATGEDLRDMVRHLGTSSWSEAHAAQERAKGRLGERDAPELRERLEQGIRDLELASRLESIRLGRARRLGKKTALTLSDKEYEAAFSNSELAYVSEKAAVVADRVGTSSIRSALLAALDDWASCTTDPHRQSWLLLVAREVLKYREEPDPTGWRERARDVDVWKDSAALGKLLETTPVANESVPLQLALAERLKVMGANPIPFLKRIQGAHSGDFWANLNLAEALMETNDLPEAIRFYQAAVAARPDAAVVYDNLGLALAMLGRMEEADQQFRNATKIDPSAADAHRNLGIVFSTLRPREAAIDVADFPPHFNRKVAALHLTLADELRDKGKLVEALDRYRQAIALDPKLTGAQQGIRFDLMRQGRMEEACRAWGKAIDEGPFEHQAWDGYAELCLFLGQEAEYRRVRVLLIERFGSTDNSHIAERTGRACLLMPTSAEEQSCAEALIKRALDAEPEQPYYQFAKGLAEYRGGRLENAIAVLKGRASTVMGPAPRLILAMAEHRQGKKADARETLAAAVRSFGWKPAPDHRDDWIYHVLRREAETLIIPNLSAFLDGTHQPRDNDERFALIDGCRYMNCNYSAARLYADAFVADPQLANDFRAGHRYEAARAAALAGHGTGEDAKTIAAEERTRLRTQARQWLQEDLTAWKAALTSDFAANRESTQKALVRWRTDPSLRTIREPGELDKMSPEEKLMCGDLWREVSAMIDRIEKAK